MTNHTTKERNETITSFLDACKYGNLPEVKREVKKLLEKEVDINIKDEYGDFALAFASFKGRKKIVELLIKAGADVNARDNEGNTPIIIASYSGYKDIVELLIKAGADVNLKNYYGTTALKWAKKNYLRIEKMLLKAGAKH